MIYSDWEFLVNKYNITHWVYQKELLAFTDEQLQEYVQNKLEEKRKEEEKRKKIKEENQRNVELELLKKLKAKYEQ